MKVEFSAFPKAFSGNVAVFVAEAPTGAEIRLSDEHDRHEWVRPQQLTRCLPAWVREMYDDVLNTLGLT